MKKVFLSCLLCLVFFVVSAENFEGIGELKFGMSREKVRATLLQNKSDYFHVTSEKSGKYTGSKKLSKKNLYEEITKQNLSDKKALNGISKIDNRNYLIDENNSVKRKFSYIKYMDRLWDSVEFSFVNNKLFQIKLEGDWFDDRFKPDIFVGVNEFMKKYEITSSKEINSFIAPSLNTEITGGINEESNLVFAASKTITSRYATATDDDKKYPIYSCTLIFLKNIPELAEYREQEQKESDYYRQKIYDEL